MPKKMGRPLTGPPKDKTLRIRVDEVTLEKLDICSEALGSNWSAVVRKGIDMVVDSLKEKTRD